MKFIVGFGFLDDLCDLSNTVPVRFSEWNLFYYYC